MILISIVMLAAFALIYVTTSKDLENNSISVMKDIAHNGFGGPENLFDRKEETEEKGSYLPTYTIELNERNKTCVLKGFGDVSDLSEDRIAYINDLIRSVNNKTSNNGILEEYNMRYYSIDIAIGKRIVLLDKRYEDYSLQQLLFSSLIIGAIAFSLFLIISVIVAKIAVKPVEKSLKQQRQLVSDVSHELKTPVTVIATNADIILSHSDSSVEAERKWLGYIKDETKRMSELINTMLYLAKSDEDTTKPDLKRLNFSNSAFEIALPFESVCYENGKTINIDIEPDIYIKADESTIKQLMAILLDNAVKYSNENGRIVFRLNCEGEKAVMSVFNTGESIPKESIPYLFDRFYRVDKARSRDKGGSGLGLSIAKKIIENNEASISVSSDIDHGTVFKCIFDIDKTKNNQ